MKFSYKLAITLKNILEIAIKKVFNNKKNILMEVTLNSLDLFDDSEKFNRNLKLNISL